MSKKVRKHDEFRVEGATGKSGSWGPWSEVCERSGVIGSDSQQSSIGG